MQVRGFSGGSANAANAANGDAQASWPGRPGDLGLVLAAARAAEGPRRPGPLDADRSAQSADRPGQGHLSRPRGLDSRPPASPNGTATPRAADGTKTGSPTRPGRAMLSKSLRLLSGAKTDAEAWAALFRHYNRTHGRGDAATGPARRVAVKLNLNCAEPRARPHQGLYNTPQVTLALLRQLVKQAGVRRERHRGLRRLALGERRDYLPCHAEFPGIRFEDREGGEGRFKIQPDKTRRAALRRSRHAGQRQDLPARLRHRGDVPDQRGAV